MANVNDQIKIHNAKRSTMHPLSALPVLGALYSPLTKSREGKEIVR